MRSLGRATPTMSSADLAQLFDATSGLTGLEFFEALVSTLGSALGVRAVLVGEAAGDSFRPLAAWRDGKLFEVGPYPIHETPCALLVGSEGQRVDAPIGERFPRFDWAGPETGTWAYVGAPVRK